MKSTSMGTLFLLLLSVACKKGPAPVPGEPLLSALRAEQGGAPLSFSESQGKRLFLQYCATCHGDEGRGDGQNASNLKPPPPDLTVSRNVDTANLKRAIAEGSAAIGRTPLSPPWGRSLSGEQIDDLVAYCQSLIRRKS
jgi:mono/diheme cytochrome c family protein